MNYYPHHIGDYAKDTAHLDMIEDGAYRRLLDICYATERPLPAEKAKVYRLARARTQAEKSAVDTVLDEFFTLSEYGWRNTRAEEELERAHEKASKARNSAAMRWQCERNANAMRTHSEGNARDGCEGNAPNNQEPIANSHKPIAKSQRGSTAGRGSRLPADWTPTEGDLMFCQQERPDLDSRLTAERFKDHWTAQPGQRGVKLDWSATWRNWVRNERRTNGSSMSLGEQNRAAAEEAVRRMEEEQRAGR